MIPEEVPQWLPLLKRSLLFSDLSAEDMQTLAIQLEPLSLPKGSTLFKQGDPGDTFYLVTSGQLRVLTHRGEEDVVSAYLGPGDSLGEMSLLTGEPRSSTVVLETTCEFLTLSKANFEQVVTLHPHVLLHVSRLISKRLYFATQSRGVESKTWTPQVVVLCSPVPTEEKVLFTTHFALALLEQTRRRVLVVDLTHQAGQLAKVLGLTPVLTSEAMLREQDLRNPDLIRNIGQEHPSGLELVSMHPQVLGGRLFRGIFLLMNMLRENHDFVIVCLDGEAGSVEHSILVEADHWILLGREGLETELDTWEARLRSSVPGFKNISYVQLIRSERPNEILRLQKGNTFIPWPEGFMAEFQRTGSPFSSLQKYPKTQRALERLARRLGGLRIGIAMGAGAALGYTLVGILKVLHRENIFLDLVAGTSMGSVIGGFYAMGMDPLEVEKEALKIDRAWLFENIFWDITIPRSGFLGGITLMRILRRYFGDREFQDLEIPLSCISTDIVTGEEIILKEGKLAEAVRASCAIPVLFQPYHYQGRYLVDGGIIDPVPARVVSQMGSDIILAVNLTLPAGERVGARRTKPPEGIRSALPQVLQGPNMWDILFRTIYTMQYEIAHSRVEVGNVLIQPDLRGYSWTDFHRAKELIEVGERACEESLDKLKAHLPFFANYCRFPIRHSNWKVY
ncbi:MAG: patatin-like phospholipase family protein [Elusimicrobia bacterium]|nr:patatin-like phospholipase family protein [Elusimicrobiota bacterium]